MSNIIDIFIDNELVHYISFQDELDTTAQKVFDAFNSSPEIYLYTDLSSIPKIGDFCDGSSSEKNFILGEGYGTPIVFVLVKNNVVEWVMPSQYMENNEIFVAAMASSPTLKRRED